MNKERLKEVAEKLDVDPFVIKKAKRDNLFKSLAYAWSQVFVYILSIVVLRYSWSIFSSENQWKSPTYPFAYFGDPLYVLINPFFWIVQIGNFTGTFFLRKKLGLRKAIIITISFVNIVLVIIGFTALHLLVSTPVSYLDPSVMYGVYAKAQNKISVKAGLWK